MVEPSFPPSRAGAAAVPDSVLFCGRLPTKPKRMVESSFPPFWVGAAAIPDSIFITRQTMIPWRCLTLTPPFLNPPSLGTFYLPGGSLWLVPGPAALLVAEGCPSGSRSCPRALYVPWPAQRPVRPAPYRPCYCAFGRSTSLRPS